MVYTNKTLQNWSGKTDISIWTPYLLTQAPAAIMSPTISRRSSKIVTARWLLMSLEVSQSDARKSALALKLHGRNVARSVGAANPWRSIPVCKEHGSTFGRTKGFGNSNLA